MKLISLVIPIYFEELIIDELYKRLKAVFDACSDLYKFEVIFINDGSTDNSLLLLRELCVKDQSLCVIDLSRNFGHQRAITAGIDYAEGDAVIIMDADLQDPPELIPKLLTRWSDGYEVVYAVRVKRNGESFFKLWTAKQFYKLLDFLSETPIPRNVGDFRLIDRKVVNQLKTLRESGRYVRGLVSWVGYRQCGLDYERDARYAGETKYPLKKMIMFAMDGITSFSGKPLYLASYVGFGIATVAAAWGIVIIVSYIFGFFTGVIGWSSLMVAILFIGGLQIAFIGIIGQYLGRVYDQVKERPLYLVREIIGRGK